MGARIPRSSSKRAGRGRLRRKDQQLVGALGLWRYLSVRQVIELGVGA